jgi:tRNA threonylcarbamoyl adenosine modification protein (Sua5/YciO/YrdC/YwlC family)
MAEILSLADTEFERALSSALKCITDGFVIAVPLEHSYAFACNAFDEDAVRAMHVLRHDEIGVAAQVMVANAAAVSGILRNTTWQLQSLMENFWPGLLSINAQPQPGLRWDLGDFKKLDLISVRVPKSDFMLGLLAQSGPLAVASAVATGKTPRREVVHLAEYHDEIPLIIDGGTLPAGPASTILTARDNSITAVRIGAITLEQLKEIQPSVSAATY